MKKEEEVKKKGRKPAKLANRGVSSRSDTDRCPQCEVGTLIHTLYVSSIGKKRMVKMCFKTSSVGCGYKTYY